MKVKIVSLITLAAVAVLIIFAVRSKYQENKEVTKEDGHIDYIVNIDEFIPAFKPNMLPGDLKYSDKIIVITGTFNQICTSPTEITVSLVSSSCNYVFCKFEKNQENIEKLKDLREPTKITIKGKCYISFCTIKLKLCSLITKP